MNPHEFPTIGRWESTLSENPQQIWRAFVRRDTWTSSASWAPRIERRRRPGMPPETFGIPSPTESDGIRWDPAESNAPPMESHANPMEACEILWDSMESDEHAHAEQVRNSWRKRSSVSARGRAPYERASSPAWVMCSKLGLFCLFSICREEQFMILEKLGFLQSQGNPAFHDIPRSSILQRVSVAVW